MPLVVVRCAVTSTHGGSTLPSGTRTGLLGRDKRFFGLSLSGLRDDRGGLDLAEGLLDKVEEFA